MVMSTEMHTQAYMETASICTRTLIQMIFFTLHSLSSQCDQIIVLTPKLILVCPIPFSIKYILSLLPALAFLLFPWATL